MNDRLAELRRGAEANVGHTALEINPESNVNPLSAKLVDNGRKTPEKFMAEFFNDVDIVKANIGVIRSAATSLSDINQQALLATTSEQEAELSRELGAIISNTNKKAAVAKQLLTRLKEETDRLKNQNGPKDANALKIRENLINTLTRKFVDVMKEYQNAQQKYKTEIKKKVKRQVQIVKPDATTEEIESVMKSGGGSSDVFKNAILKGDAADPIRNAYMNVADKYQDVLTLEASVKELHQMFVDFALLTEQQGELLDQIEFQVKAASDYIDDANVDLVQSIEYQKQIRKRQLCIAIILIVVLGVIVLIIMGVTGNLK